MATVLDSIKRYQYIIDKHSNDEHKVLKCINKLYHLDVTVQHLQETGVGRTINSLRKESGDVGPAARSLVQKWKEMVAAEESDEDGYQSHETTTYNGHGSGRESDDNGRHDSKSEDTTTSKINGSHSGTKRAYHSSEEEESNVKKSKYSYDYHTEGKEKKEETGRLKRDEPVKVPKKEPEYESNESDASDSGESDSSESSIEYSKTKRPDKKEMSSNHTASKHSSQNSHHSAKRDSSSSKNSHHKEKHTENNSSSSKERHSSDKSHSKEKAHSHEKESSHKHKSSDDKVTIPEKKQKSDHKTSDHKLSSKDSKSSSKHSKGDEHRAHKHESSEKHKSSSEKHTNKSDKHRSSSHTQHIEKEKLKHSDVETSKHRSRDSHSSSSKEKSSSSSKEKSKDKTNSSKDKLNSHSSHKHASDSKSSSSEHKSKSDKHETRSSEKKARHKSSSSINQSSDHKSEKSSSKTKENVPKKKDEENHEDSDDGIDCGSGASFAEALGMISPAKPKKKFPQLIDVQSPNSSFSNDLSPAALLAPTAKLAPLPPLEITALPEISPNYKPRAPPKPLPHFTDDEALNAGISSKNQRTKVYSGNKVLGKIPSLYEMCVHILQEHIDALEFTGGVPYNILKPVVDRATPQQLFTLEHFNPYLMEDTDHLWQKFCQKSFRNKQRHEMESWREMYLRCQEEQEHRLKALTANIKITQEAKKAPIKQTKMAYVDTAVKPPRNVARKQAQHGTAHASTASPAARVASLAAAPNVARAGAVRPPPPTTLVSSHNKPKKAPLMAKALQFMRGRKR